MTYKMQQKQNIILWKCHVCEKEFDTIGGGICKECGKATCHICFGLSALKKLYQFKMPKTGVCRLCVDKKDGIGEKGNDSDI